MKEPSTLRRVRSDRASEDEESEFAAEKWSEPLLGRRTRAHQTEAMIGLKRVTGLAASYTAPFHRGLAGMDGPRLFDLASKVLLTMKGRKKNQWSAKGGAIRTDSPDPVRVVFYFYLYDMLRGFIQNCSTDESLSLPCWPRKLPVFFFFGALVKSYQNFVSCFFYGRGSDEGGKAADWTFEG